jgi:hypothetical protein
MTALLSFLVLPIFSAETQPKDDKRPSFGVKLRKSEDRFETILEKARVVWKVTSKSGIGGAEVDLKSGEPPRVVVIRFAGMKNLESFRLRAGRVKLSSRLGRGRGLLFDEKGDLVADPMSSIGSLSVENKDGHIEVTLRTTKPGKRWAFRWVNEFR